jgi:6-pyruvoyl-tetrahydropterin synthase
MKNSSIQTVKLDIIQQITSSNDTSLINQIWNLLNSNKNVVSESQDIPYWHKSELDKRSQEFYANPTQVLNFNNAMDELEKEL